MQTLRRQRLQNIILAMQKKGGGHQIVIEFSENFEKKKEFNFMIFCLCKPNYSMKCFCQGILTIFDNN